MKTAIIRFLKSIIIGLGGIAPGLSGSVLMIIFGLYKDTLDALSTFYINFKRKVAFLFPIICGIGIGIILFSKVIDFFFDKYTIPTRYAFLGLILGTVPLFLREVKKEGFYKRHYLVAFSAFIVSMLIFTLNTRTFPQLTDPNFLQKVLLGVAVVTSAIVPGVDPTVLLSTFGLYDIYLSSLASLNFDVLIPMVLGVGAGAIVVSLTISKLFKHFYTTTFSVIFGAFLAMIPNMILDKSEGRLDIYTCNAVCILLTVIGFVLAYYMGDIQTNNRRIKVLFTKIKRH